MHTYLIYQMRPLLRCQQNLKIDVLIVECNILNFNLIHNVFGTQSEVFFHLILPHLLLFFYCYDFVQFYSFAICIVCYSSCQYKQFRCTKICKFYCHSLEDAFPDVNRTQQTVHTLHTIPIYSKLGCSVFRNIHCLKSKRMPISLS